MISSCAVYSNILSNFLKSRCGIRNEIILCVCVDVNELKIFLWNFLSFIFANSSCLIKAIVRLAMRENITFYEGGGLQLSSYYDGANLNI